VRASRDGMDASQCAETVAGERAEAVAMLAYRAIANHRVPTDRARLGGRENVAPAPVADLAPPAIPAHATRRTVAR
jgi:hypothetical protein